MCRGIDCWRLICHYIVRDYILVHQLTNVGFIHSDCCIVCCHLPDTRKPCIENRSRIHRSTTENFCWDEIRPRDWLNIDVGIFGHAPSISFINNNNWTRARSVSFKLKLANKKRFTDMMPDSLRFTSGLPI